MATAIYQVQIEMIDRRQVDVEIEVPEGEFEGMGLGLHLLEVETLAKDKARSEWGDADEFHVVGMERAICS